MTKRLFLTSVLLASSLLAACGGGGSPIPNPGPSPTNAPTKYSVSIIVRGGANTAQSATRAPEVAAMDGTPAPIMLGAAPFASLPSGYSGGVVGNDVSVQAEVSPQPSSTPDATFTTTATGVTFAPLPSPLPDTQQMKDDNTSQNQGSSGIVTATVPSLSIQTTRTVDIYPETFFFYSATKSTPNGMSNGISIQNGSVVATNASPGDVYLDGNGNLVIPGGAVSINGDTHYYDITASRWSNSYTSIPLNTIATEQIADGALANQSLLFKASDGEIGKITFIQTMPGNGGSDQMLETFVEVAGHSIDGF